MLRRIRWVWHAGSRQLGGPLAPWWWGGLLLALLVKFLGIQFGGAVSLCGLALLSCWLPVLAEKSGRRPWHWRQRGLVWTLLLLMGLVWLPLGWGGYLATLQASLHLPVAWQNVIFNRRYDWLPVVVPLWSLSWLGAFKWLPSLGAQLRQPTHWSDFWLTGWRTSWWSVVKASRPWLRYATGWLICAGGLIGVVWVTESWWLPLGHWVAVLSLAGLQLGVWWGLMAAWTHWWPTTAEQAAHLNWLGGLLVILPAVGYAGWWLQPTSDRLPAVIAHRGVDGRDGVQNTTSALKRTVKHVQPALVEMDIQPTADRHWVVMHDPTLTQLADRPGVVHEYRLDQLAGLPLQEHGQRGRLPTFDQYLRVANDVQQPLLVEIKAVGDAARLMGPFADDYGNTLIKHGDAVHSLDYQVIVRLKQRQQRLRVGWITPFYLTDFSANVTSFYSLQALTATREQVAAAHRQHRSVYLWTVDRAFAMHRLSALGVDGLITNYPGRLQNLQNSPSHYYFYQLINWLVSWL